VKNDGAYIWEGGNSSRKISTLPDDFYNRQGGNPTTGVQVQHCRWSQFVVFPNLWMFDCVTESWWRLDQATHALVEAGKGSPNLLFCAQDSFTTPSTTTVFVYDDTISARTYRWECQPIRVTEAKRIDIVEVVVSVSNVGPSGATVKVGVLDGVGSASVNATFDFDADGKLRIPIGVTNAPHIRSQVVVTSKVSDEAAPTLNAISWGWQPSTPLTQQ